MRARHQLTAAIGVGALLLMSGCGDDDGPAASSPTTNAVDGGTAAETSAADEGSSSDDGKRDDVPGKQPDGNAPDRGPEPSDAARDESALDAQAAYRDYIDAIDDRDGAALCVLLSPAAVRELRAPVERASCAATLHDSIGYRDPRGFPVWKHTTLSDFEGTQVSHDLATARITAAIVTAFADRNEPSVESDIAYLEPAGGTWRLAKPSGALYRAVGNAELPPSVIVPPQG